MQANHVLNRQGYYRVRTNGSHAIYKNVDGQMITITMGKKFSQKTWKRECKRVGILEV